MIIGGEDPTFIARRMVVFSFEDIGLAQPTALVVANEVFRAGEEIGTAYLALAAKVRSEYDGYFEALEDVKKLANQPIPMKVRNAPPSS